MRDMGIAEAAQALGVSADTVRRRLKRGQLDARRDNTGKWWVRLPADAEPERAQAVSAHGPMQQPLMLPPTQNADLHGEIAWLRGRVEALVAEQAEERAERARLFDMLERQGEHLRALTDRRPWWRRLFGRA